MPSFKILSASAVAVVNLCMASSAMATNVLITFDAGDPVGGLAVGAVLSNQYAAFGATFVANAFSGLSSPNGGWATNTDMTIVSSTGADVGALGAPGLAGGNLLHSFNNYLNENGDPSFSIVFSGSGVNSFSATFAGVTNPGAVNVYAYNGNFLLGSVAGTAAGQFTLTYSSAAPITRVAITPGDYNDWVGVDNIAFSTISAVPEPADYALLSAGVVALWWARRRGVA